MEQFPHLNFIQKVTGSPRLRGGGETHPKTQENKDNRRGHSQILTNRTSTLKTKWKQFIDERESLDLAPLEGDNIPVFIQINPELLAKDLAFDLSKQLGIEIISEEEDGYIVGASSDGLLSLEDKINGFLANEYGTSKVADLWQIIEGNREDWKPEHILSDELLDKWTDIEDDKTYVLEVGVAFDKPLGAKPDPSKQGGETRLANYMEKLLERDNLLMEREQHFADFIGHYGAITSSLINLEDSFTCEVEITGKGLKDLVVNYPFVFEVVEKEEIGGPIGSTNEIEDFELEILPPKDNSPEVVVIDSGIMENNKFIEFAISPGSSKSYIRDSSTADKVKGGGHGTKVAGAILYPKGISSVVSPYVLPCFIRNNRVLDEDNKLISNFPAELMERIVDDNEDCDIFNLSINSNVPFRKKHMSSWAATIDNLIFERNVLFIISSGNIDKRDIKWFLSNGMSYPEYLHEAFCGIANPAQSSFALVVGSINHTNYIDDSWVSLGELDDISAFSRVGTGIWGEIKPDIVEYGGGLVCSKNGMNQIRENETTAVELIRSTYHGGSAFGKDSTGTSFATPKVSTIVAELRKLYPDENVNLIRALVAQGARLPKKHFINPTSESIKFYGYGFPSLDRVTRNTEHRITFYNTRNIKAEEGHIYSLSIPDSIRNPGNDFDVLIEVSLAYTARVRRTRQRTKSYLSTWLDWSSSYFDEPLEDFKTRALKEIDGDPVVYEKEDTEVIKWKIRENSEWGDVKGINRNNSTLQKDWTIMKAYSLSSELSFAVRGHKGWDKNFEEIPYALVVSIEILNQNIPIYEEIRLENEIELPIEI